MKVDATNCAGLITKNKTKTKKGGGGGSVCVCVCGGGGVECTGSKNIELIAQVLPRVTPSTSFRRQSRVSV